MQKNGFNQGTAFKNGKLYLFSRTRVIVVKPWPEMRAWTRTRTTGWKATRDLVDRRLDIVLETPDVLDAYASQISLWGAASGASGAAAELRRQFGWWEFCRRVPRDLLLQIECFRERRWHLLAMAARCPQAADLIFTNPALAVALSSLWVFRNRAESGRAMSLIRRMAGRKQREIAEWLGFGSSSSTATLLSKIPARWVTVERLLYLRTLLTSHDFTSRADAGQVLKRLRHAPQLDPIRLRFYTDLRLRAFASDDLVEKLANKYSVVYGSGRCELIREDFSNLMHDLRRSIEIPEQPFCSERALRAFLSARDMPYDFGAQKIPVEWLPAAFRQSEMAVLPEAFTGDDEFFPLKTVADMEREATEMSHCLASPVYLSRLHDDRYRFFSITKPHRGTVMLNRSKNGWRVAEAQSAQKHFNS